jgi:hypothetical protein
VVSPSTGSQVLADARGHVGDPGRITFSYKDLVRRLHEQR